MKRCLTVDEEIFLNQFLQGLFSLEQMNEWFDKHDKLERKNIINNLFYMFVQSHPTYAEIEEAALSIKKVKSTPAIKLLNRNKPYQSFGHEVSDLPECELQTTFDILLLTFAKADARRKKQECSNGCSHWWHKDLSDERYLQSLRESRVKNLDAWHYDPDTGNLIKES